MPDSIIDTGEKRINEAVCIDTKRIYDSCVSKDCLEDLRVTFYAPAQMLVDNAVTVKCRDCTIEAVSIDVDEVPFDNGFYSVDVTYYFKLTFDCYSAPCTVPMVATGYTSFNKKCILYGSSGNVKVFVSNVSAEALDCPEAPQYTNPSAKVQAVDPVILSMDVVCSCDCRVPCLTSMPKSITSTLDNSTLPERPAKAVLVTLGLFSIIQMERDVPPMTTAFRSGSATATPPTPARPSPALTFRWMSSSQGKKRTAALAARTAATPAPIPPTTVTIAKIQKAPLTVPRRRCFFRIFIVCQPRSSPGLDTCRF